MWRCSCVVGVGWLPLGLRFAGAPGICCLLDFCVCFRCLGFVGLLIRFLICCLVDCSCCYVYWFLLGFLVLWLGGLVIALLLNCFF